jgi:hypothetical protein
LRSPRQVVWDLLADPKRHTELGTFVAEVTVITPGEVREGSVYRERSGPGFMKSESEWTITKLESPRQLIHESKEKSTIATATWTLSELGPEATRATQVLDFEMMPRLRILGRLLEGLFAIRMTQKETQRMLQDLKRLAEGPNPS